MAFMQVTASDLTPEMMEGGRLNLWFLALWRGLSVFLWLGVAYADPLCL